MQTYRTPGVYFEWLDAPPALAEARMDIAGFAGIAERGPLDRAVRAESWNQFTSAFGHPCRQGHLAYAVQGFFANGGRTCYVVRVADPAWARPAMLDIVPPDGTMLLRLTASSPGAWAHQMAVSVIAPRPGRFTLTLALPGGEQEIWRDLSFDPADERFAPRQLNAGAPPSSLVTAQWLARTTADDAPALTLRAAPQRGFPAGGADGLWTLGPEHFIGATAQDGAATGLALLEAIPEIGVLALPDLAPPNPPPAKRRPYRPRCEADAPAHRPAPAADPDMAPALSRAEVEALQRELIAQCERTRNRTALLDPPPDITSPQAVIAWRRRFDSAYAAFYFPWLRVPEAPDSETLLRSVPPCGHVAGIYARTDREFGVHKAPANELFSGVQDVAVPLDDALHGLLNDNGVNAIRAIPGRGLRIMGARTISSDSMWRYVNVRRLLLMIERTLAAQTQWLVHEPNNQDLWRAVDRIVRDFLDRLYQRGMLDGATADEAYRVVVDESANPAYETEAGRLIASIRVKPPWPAEFVVVRIGRTENGTQFLEGKEGENGADQLPR